MSVWREVGMECNSDHCKESLDLSGAMAIVSHLVTDARNAGWLVSRDMMITYCPEHRDEYLNHKRLQE